MSDSHLVYQSMTQVADDIARIGVGKEGWNAHDKYAFRGIDTLFNVLAPIFARHKIVVLPRVVDRSVTERTARSGGSLVHTVLIVDYDICAEDGSKHTIRAIGEAMDRGDKSIPKAMSAAYKAAMFQAFCIPLSGQMPDADDDSYETENGSADEQDPEVIEAAESLRESTSLADLKRRWELIPNAKLRKALSVLKEEIKESFSTGGEE